MVLAGVGLRGRIDPGVLVLMAIPLIALLVWFVMGLVRVARCGRLPAILKASPDGLSADLPLAAFRRQRYWPAASIADVSVRQAGLLPSLHPVARLRIVAADGDDLIFIPYRGTDLLIAIERNLRDVLGCRQRVQALARELAERQGKS